MANSAPVLSGLDASTIFLESTVNTAPQLIDTTVSLADADGNFAGSMLTVAGLLAEDIVSVRNQGVDAGQIGFSNGAITFEGHIIGAAVGGVGGTLTIVFNRHATTVTVEAVIETLTYANSSDAPAPSRTLTLSQRKTGTFPSAAPLRRSGGRWRRSWPQLRHEIRIRSRRPASCAFA